MYGWVILGLLSPILLILLVLVARITTSVIRYQILKRNFKDLPRVPKMPNLGLGSFMYKEFHTKLPPILYETFPDGIPPLIFGGFSLSGKPTVFVTDPAAIRTVSDDLVFPKGVLFDTIGEFLGNGIVVSRGDYWQQQRTLINPWFHANKLKGMATSMITDGEELVSRLRSFKGQPVDVVELMGRTTQKVLIDSMLSGKLDADWVHEAWAKANLALSGFLFGSVLLGSTINNLKIWPWTRKVYENRASLRAKVQVLIDDAVKKGGDKEGDFIEYLVANGSSSNAIFEEVLTMLFAGHDTTKNTISWLVYFIGQNPEILQTLQQEVDTELKGAPPTFNDLNKLRNCRNAFMETLRLRPPAPSIGRAVGEDVTLCGQYFPKGSSVTMYFHGPMINPKYWVDPLKFNPDRFDSDPQYTHHFMPFSTGRRNCIGQKFALQEGTIFAAILAQNFDIDLCKEYPVIAKFEGTMVPKGLRCKFIDRKK